MLDTKFLLNLCLSLSSLVVPRTGSSPGVAIVLSDEVQSSRTHKVSTSLSLIVQVRPKCSSLISLHNQTDNCGRVFTIRAFQQLPSQPNKEVQYMSSS